jgi:hypothetical protein
MTRRVDHKRFGTEQKPTWKRSAYCDECERPRARRGHGDKGTAFARLHWSVLHLGANVGYPFKSNR